MIEDNGLPEGWVRLRIGDVARINYRDPEIRNLPDDLPVTFLPMAAVDAEKGIIAEPEIRPLSEVRKGFTPFKEGDVLFAKITPSMENGKAAIAEGLKNGLGFGSTEFHAIQLEENISPEWIYHFIRQHSFRMEAKASFRGTAGQLRVPKQFLENYEIPVPPRPEQDRIVAKLEETFTQLEAGIAELQNAKAQLKRYRAAVLKSAVEGELTREWREAHRRGTGLPLPQDGRNKGGRKARPDAEKLLARILSERRKLKKYKELHKLITNDFPELPEGWTWISLEILALIERYSISSGPFGSALGRKDYREKGVPVIRGQNINNGKFLVQNFVFVSEDKAKQLERSSAKPGDLVIVAVGSSGNAAIIPEAIPKGVLSQNINKISLDTSLCSPKYILFALQTAVILNQLRDKITDVVRQFLSLTNLRKVAFPIPPLAEQQRIVEMVERRLSVADAIEKELDGALVRAERLRGSVLKAAFEGRLV